MIICWWNTRRFCRTARVTVAIQFCSVIFFPHSRELQAQETLQNGQLGCGEGIPDLQPGNLASQAMIEKILSEDPRWQGNVTLSPFSFSLMMFDPICWSWVWTWEIFWSLYCNRVKKMVSISITDICEKFCGSLSHLYWDCKLKLFWIFCSICLSLLNTSTANLYQLGNYSCKSVGALSCAKYNNDQSSFFKSLTE